MYGQSSLRISQSPLIGDRDQTNIAGGDLDFRRFSTVDISASGSRANSAERTDVIVKAVSSVRVLALVSVGTGVAS